MAKHAKSNDSKNTAAYSPANDKTVVLPPVNEAQDVSNDATVVMPPVQDKTKILSSVPSIDDGNTTTGGAAPAAVQFANFDYSGYKKKSLGRKLLPLWIILAILVLLAGAAAFGVNYFQTRALPGVTLWGNSVTGLTQQEVANKITDQMENTKVPVNFNGQTQSFSLAQLGATVDADKIASEVVSAKRTSNWWDVSQYLPTESKDVSPDINTASVSSSAIDQAFSIETKDPVDAQVLAAEDDVSFTVEPASFGQGADTQAVIDSAVSAVKSLGSSEPQSVDLTLGQIAPNITDEIANNAVGTLTQILDNKVGIKINDTTIYTFDAPGLVASMSIDSNEKSELSSSQVRNGYCVFDANKIQAYWNDTIKPNFSSTREDRVVVTNNYGDEIKVQTEGHDGVTVADGSDTNIGEQLLADFKAGSGSVSVQGQADPMQTQTTKKHIVVSLSGHTVTCYENDEVIATYGCGVGQGNDPVTGQYIYSDQALATPAGDFRIERKVLDDYMKGETYVNGVKETWDAGHVGYSNYFISASGHSIHRITDETYNATLLANHWNTSHGCVGIGWDVAPIFFEWADLGVSVHIQF